MMRYKKIRYVNRWDEEIRDAICEIIEMFKYWFLTYYSRVHSANSN